MQIFLENNNVKSMVSRLCMFIKDNKNEEAIRIMNNIEPDSLFRCNRSLLHRAVEYNNLVMAQYLIDNGWDIESRNICGETPLQIASNQGKADMILILRRQLVDEMKKSSTIDKSIRLTKPRWPNDLQRIKKKLYAVTRYSYGYKEIAEELLRLNCPLAAVVCVFKTVELTKMMLDRGCLVDSRLASTGETALHLAIEDFDISNVKLLLDYGANVDATDNMNSTPLSRFKITSGTSDRNLEILKLMIDRGASLTVTCSRSRSSGWNSHGPTRTVMNKVLLEGDMHMQRLMIPYIDLYHKDKEGCTTLHHLVNSRNQYSLEILQGKSVDANVPDNNGWTPRDIAVSKASYEKVRFLLEHGANLNNFDHDGDVAVRQLLYKVVSSEEAKNVFELLLFYDVNLELLTQNHSTYVAFYRAMKNLDFAKSVFAHLAKLESLGVSLTEFFKKKIKIINKDLRNYFDLCKRQIEEMKVTTFYESITLYKLLTESEKRLTTYARNEEFQLYYESFKNNEYPINSYYAKLLKFRIDKAIATAKIKNEAACIICQITGFPKSVVITIAHIITDYLNQIDIENVIKIF